MVNDILTLDQSYSDFPTDQTFSHFHDLDTSLTFTEYEWFPWSIFNECSMQAGNAYPSDTWLRPFVELAYALNVETSFPELCVFSALFTLNIPQYFLDFVQNR